MSPNGAWPWSVLGLDKMPPTTGDIRRAYARALKGIDQSKDIEGFTALRAAYDRGMALREGRTAQTEKRKARKAETLETVPPPPSETAAPSAPVIPPPPSAHDQREAALRDFLRELDQDNVIISAGQRILAVLNHPLAHDAKAEAQIRVTIASLIRRKFLIGEEGSMLSPQISREALMALDERFGWLSDYAAFRRDFWQNRDLQDAMISRAFGRIPQPVIPARRSKHGKFVTALIQHQRHFWLFCMVGLIQVARALAELKFERSAFFIAEAIVLLPLGIVVLVVLFSFRDEILWRSVAAYARLRHWTRKLLRR
jgi:hypothetical protein